MILRWKTDANQHKHRIQVIVKFNAFHRQARENKHNFFEFSDIY